VQSGKGGKASTFKVVEGQMLNQDAISQPWWSKQVPTSFSANLRCRQGKQGCDFLFREVNGGTKNKKISNQCIGGKDGGARLTEIRREKLEAISSRGSKP